MKKLIYLLLFSPLLVSAQNATDYMIFEINTMSVPNDKTAQVENAMGAHNKKYHASGPAGARVYTIVTGKGSGDYKWVMGPTSWASLDKRPDDEAHNLDWDANVERNLGENGNTEYIRLDPALSRFPKDFNVDKLFVRYIDVQRGKMDEFKEILKKINRVYAEKIPTETYGVFYNEIPSSSSGRDVTVVSYFNTYAWMSAEDGFDAKYDEIFGKDSADALWNQWQELTVGTECEIWEFQEDLSGLPPLVKAMERQ